MNKYLKKQLFMHNVYSDGSKTANIIKKGYIAHHHIA